MEEENKIEIPEDFEVNLDDSDEEEDESEEESADESASGEGTIEEIVADTPSQNINFSSDFAPQQFVSSQPKAISPVLESRPIQEQTNLENQLPETFTQTPTETAGQQAQAYDAGGDYYADNYQNNPRNPEIMQPVDPTIRQDVTRMQSQQRLASKDSGWGAPRTQNWEKQYDVKFKEPKNNRRRR